MNYSFKCFKAYSEYLCTCQTLSKPLFDALKHSPASYKQLFSHMHANTYIIILNLFNTVSWWEVCFLKHGEVNPVPPQTQKHSPDLLLFMHPGAVTWLFWEFRTDSNLSWIPLLRAKTASIWVIGCRCEDITQFCESFWGSNQRKRDPKRKVVQT